MSSNYPQRPVFTAERRMQMSQRRASTGVTFSQTSAEHPKDGDDSESPTISSLSASDFIRIELGQALETLRQELRQDIDTMLSDRLKTLPQMQPPASTEEKAVDAKPVEPKTANTPQQAPSSPTGGMSAEEELAQIKGEIRKMSETINRTKQEIAAIYSTSLDNKRMDVMRDELGSVVKDTEVATSTILESMEIIDEVAQFIKSATHNDEIAAGGDNILDQVVRVFETCNFQDLTGQRINKVVNTMKFIEEKVNNLVTIWGEEDLSQYDNEEVKGMDDLDKTLATVDAEKEKVTQEDIDKLFG